MLRLTTGNGTLLRVFGAIAVAILLALPVAQTTRAFPPDGDPSYQSWLTRADSDIAICNSEGGRAELDFIADADGNVIGVTVACYPFNLQSSVWACTETATQSTCGSIFPAPTPPNDRAPINSGVNAPVDTGQPTPTRPDVRLPVIVGTNAGRSTGERPAPTPLPPRLIDTLQNQTTAEMNRCADQGGTPTRTETRIGNDLHETLMQCKGGGQNGMACLNTGTGANCQIGQAQLPKQPVLQIRNPGGTAATPTTVATQATLSLVPAGTPGAGSSSTPAANTGNRTVIGGIAVKPGPAKLPPEVTNSAVYVNAWTCPPTITSYHDVNQLKQVCQDLNDTDIGLNLRGVADEIVHGDLARTGLPAGQYGIAELLPYGSGPGLLYCNVVPTGAPPPTVWTLVFAQDIGYYQFSLADNQTIYCNWFYSLPAGSGTINGRNSGLRPEVTAVATPRS